MGFLKTCCRIALLLLAVAPAAAETRFPGYPATDALWTNSEYVQFYFAHAAGHRALPHLRSAEGRRLFFKLVDRASIDAIAASPDNDMAKQQQLALIIMAVGAIRAAYNIALIEGEPVGEELARVQEFQLRAIARALSVPAEPKPRAAWVTAILGVAQSLAEAGRYAPAERAILAEALAENYAELSVLLDGRTRTRLKMEVGALAPAAESEALAASLAALSSVLEEW